MVALILCILQVFPSHLLARLHLCILSLCPPEVNEAFAMLSKHCDVTQISGAYGGPLMAVDFGGEFIKVSVVKPGRTPISIVPNEMSKRRTSAQVGFAAGATHCDCACMQ